MTLAFLSPAGAAPDVRRVSPLARVDFRGPVRAASTGVVELRGPHDEPGLVRLTPDRALLLTDDPLGDRDRLRSAGVRAYDLTAAYAAIDVDGERLFRRLSDLDPAALPAAGPVARGVAALVTRSGETFRLLVPQELAHSVAELALDAAEGLA